MVRGSGCDGVLNTLKGYKDQSPSVTTSMEVNGNPRRNECNEPESSRNWMERFMGKTSIGPTTTSTIISHLNDYHRYGALAGTDGRKDIKWNAINKVTPPSGALKSPWEEQARESLSKNNPQRKYPGGPPPLLLSGSNPAFTSTISRSSLKTTTAQDSLLSSPAKKGVPHVYHDYSNIPDAIGVVRKKTGGVTQPFPEKLHTMLDDDGDPSVVSWLPHGRAFLVRKPAEFTTQIMPKYFRQTKLTSFQRQARSFVISFFYPPTSYCSLGDIDFLSHSSHVVISTALSVTNNIVESLWISKTNTRCRCWSILSRVVLERTPSIVLKNATAEN